MLVLSAQPHGFRKVVQPTKLSRWPRLLAAKLMPVAYTWLATPQAQIDDER